MFLVKNGWKRRPLSESLNWKLFFPFLLIKIPFRDKLPHNYTQDVFCVYKSHWSTILRDEFESLAFFSQYHQWHSQYRARGGGRVLPDSKIIVKNQEKERKREEKSGKNREEKTKIGKVLSLCPSWQIGLATLPVLSITGAVSETAEPVLGIYEFLYKKRDQPHPQ